MTTLVPELGLGTSGANSYCDLAFADDYFAAHPFYSETWEEIEAEKRTNLLIFATSQLDSMISPVGYPSYTNQPLRFPRYGATTLDGALISSSTIPVQLKQAVCEMALYLSQSQNNVETVPDSTGISELKIDVIQLKFTAPVRALPVPLAVSRLLRGLGTVQNGSRVRKVRVEV